jgi:hypothetical protein
MGEPKGKRNFRDEDRMNITERHQVEYWVKRWGVTKDQITTAYRKVGNSVRDIGAELGKKR